MVALFCDVEFDTLARIQGDNTSVLLGWLWIALPKRIELPEMSWLIVKKESKDSDR